MATLDISERLGEGTRVGRFVIDEWIAAGGTADVYSCRASDDVLTGSTAARQRYVAKIFRFYGDEKDYKRKRRLFEREGEVLEAISGNIHVVNVFEKGLFRSQETPATPRPFTILQRLAGGSLADLICERKYEEDDAARIAVGLLDALVYAHSCGYLHCDVKPDNVMMDESGNPVWIDFGISKEIDMPADVVSIMSERGAVAVGTAPYMSPEHFLGRHSLCPQSDVWSMGVLLMRMLTWLYPFGLHFEQVRQRTLIQSWHRFDELPVFKTTETIPEVSPSMQAIILKCLQVELEDRYESAAALKADLDALARGRPLTHAGTGAAPAAAKPVLSGGGDAATADSVERSGNTTIYNYGMSKRSALIAGISAGVVIVVLAAIFALFMQRSLSPAAAGEDETAAASDTIDVAPPGETLARSVLPPAVERPQSVEEQDDLASEEPVEEEPGETAPEVDDAQEIEGMGTPVSVRLYPNRGYRGERVTVNGRRVSATDGLVRPFEGRVGQVFEWEIMGTDGKLYQNRVQIPSEARTSRVVRINWQTGAVGTGTES